MKSIKSVVLILAVLFIKIDGIFCFDKGIKFGLNLSTLNNQKMIDSELSAGLSSGGFLKFRLTDRLSFQPELFFTMRSISFDGRVNQKFDNDNDGLVDEDPFDLIDNDGDGEIDEDKIDYFCDGKGDINSKLIEIPLSVDYCLLNSKSILINIFGGPSFNLLLSNSIELANSLHYDLEISDDYFDFGGVIGFDFYLNKFILDIRYSNSMLDNDWEIEPDLSSFPFPDDYNASGFYPRILKSRYSSLNIMLGFLF